MPDGIPSSFDNELVELRNQIRELGKVVMSFMSRDDYTALAPSEVKANIMLSYRHLEDARMRLGKVLEAKNGAIN